MYYIQREPAESEDLKWKIMKVSLKSIGMGKREATIDELSKITFAYHTSLKLIFNFTKN